MGMRGSVALVAFAALTGAVGCGDGDRAARREQLPPEADVQVEHAPGDGRPAFGSVPFPSDLHLDDRGFVSISRGFERVVGKGAEVLTSGLADTAGFARQVGGVFFLSGSIDPTTLPEAFADGSGAHALLADVDPESDLRGTRTPVRVRWLPGLGCLTVTALPGAVLPPGVRHALVVTTRVRDASGAPIGASPELRSIMTLDPEERVTPSERLHGDALDALVETGAVERRSDVAGLAVFTTSRSWEELFDLRARVRATAAPQAHWEADSAAPYRVARFAADSTPSLTDWLGTAPRDENGAEWPGGDDPTGIAHDAIGAVASFAMTAPSFLAPATSHFAREADGTFAAQAPVRIPVTLVLPAAPPPASGYPVVLHGHGLSNDRGSMLSNANELARAGFAIVGIDDVLHGTRAGLADESSRFPGSWDGPDGIPDTLPFPVAFFGAFANFLIPRDSFRQTVLDQVSLVRLVQNPALDLSPLAASDGTVPRLDGTRVAWSGGSLGGIVGSMVASVETEIDAAALQVPGAGFIPFVVAASAELAPLIATIAENSFEPPGDEPLDEAHPLAILLSQITEAGDPAAYVGAMQGARPDGAPARHPHVLVTYAWDDEVLPNLSTHALLRAMGVPLAGDVIGVPEAVERIDAPVRGNRSGATVAAIQYAPSNHALGYNRYDVRRFAPGHPASDPAQRFPPLPAAIRLELPIREHSRQLSTFLLGAAAGVPEITVTAPARADFDADGVDDAAEAAAGTDPWDPTSR